MLKNLLQASTSMRAFSSSSCIIRPLLPVVLGGNSGGGGETLLAGCKFTLFLSSMLVTPSLRYSMQFPVPDLGS